MLSYSTQTKVKMPKNQQNMTKSKARKAVKQERYQKVALSDDSAIYGRVIKALGQRQFRVIVPDQVSRKLIEVTAKIPKKRSLITVGDIVVTAASGTSYEIQANMDKKAIHMLEKEKKIHPDLLAAADWDSSKNQVILKNDAGFEFDYEGLPDVKEEREEIEDDSDDEKEIDIDDI